MYLKARSAVWRLWLSTLGGLFLLGCAQTGRIYVSTPQINTRERLVARRLEESEWLKRQLTNSDTITTTFQGVEDFREFAGFYAQVRAAFDPSQGALSAGTLNNQLLAQETEQWQLKKLNLEAKNDYLRALSSTNTATATSSNTPGSTPPNTNPAPSAPGLPSPPSNSFSNPPALPSPTNIVETQAKAGLLDLLHDKMAYRTEVISAIKSVELDDSHDLAGMMLYDLNFSVTIVPGDNLERLAQVKISLQDQNEPGQLARRVPELRRFFSVWKDELQAEIIRDAAGLQHRFTNRQLNQNDQNFIRWFLVTELPVLRSQLEQEHELIKGLQQTSPSWTDFLKVAAQHRLFYLFTPAMVKGREEAPARGEELQKAAARVHSMLEAVEKLESAAASANSREVLALLTNESGSTVSLDPPGGRLVLETIPLAVWCKYHDTLGRFVIIEAPQTAFASTNVGPRLSGLKVTE